MKRTSARGDRQERDADRAADRVTRGERADVQATSATPAIQRACASCDEEMDEDLTLARAAAGSGDAVGVTDEALAILGGPGHALDGSVRSAFEPLFGHDLGGLRIHTGPAADRAARSIDAIAYTAGRDLVFREGAYQPTHPSGRRLLAHEIAHSVQQGAAPIARRDLALADAEAETEAEGAAERVSAGESAGVDHGRPPAIARFRGPPPRTPPRVIPRVAPRPVTRTAPGGGPLVETVESDPMRPTPYHEQYYAPDPWDTSLHAMMYNASIASARERVIFEGERPFATLQRGGEAPRFTTFAGRASSIGNFGHVWYDTYQFHLLDAMEHAIANARSAGELASIYMEFIPDGLIYNLMYDMAMGDGSGMAINPRFGRRWLPWDLNIPDSLDPGGVQRARVFMAAASQRAATLPDLATSPLAQWLADNEAHMLSVIQRDQRSSGPCHVYTCPRASCGGGNAEHDAFATHVTGGNPDELVVNTPEGISCQFDGEDLTRPGQVWEVKTRHEFLTDLGLVRRGMSATVLAAILRLESQRARCAFAANRCGYQYAYAFDDCVVARAFRSQWGNIPPVYYREFREPRPC